MNVTSPKARPETANIPDEARLAWKIAADPHYRETMRRYGSFEVVTGAGFFDDGLAPGLVAELSDPRLLATPLAKARIRLESLSPGARPLALFTTGGFAPVHEGHINMMEAAKRRMEAAGYDVVAGFMVPAHDSYVAGKIGDPAAFPAYKRLDFLSRALAASDWLAPDPWLALYAPADLNFTDVLRRLARYLAAHLTPGIEVAYVFGADNAGFARAFVKSGLCVCVKRPGFEDKLASVAADSALEGRLHIAEGDLDISSRQVRKGEKPPMDCFGEPVVFDAAAAPAQFYCIRDDLDWATEPWNRAGRGWAAACGVFLLGLRAALEGAFARSALGGFPPRVQTIVVPAEEQRRWLQDRLTRTPFINLDCVTAAGAPALHYSRLFPLSDSQLFAPRLVPRPGAPSPAESFSALPAGQYMLVDDDIATGFSMKAVEKELPAGVSITGRVSLLDEWLRERFPERRSAPWDILDARDFLLGAHGGGLVVEGFDGGHYRAPWVPPYVSLLNRARVPPDQELALALNIFRLNQAFFADSGLMIRDADPAFARLMEKAGFDGRMTLEALCAWHISRLEQPQPKSS
jgi:nicotinic acid mononucleotide adenylyltransferase